MKISIREVMAAVRATDAALVGEVAGYLVLGALDAFLARPAGLTPDCILLDESGEIVLTGAALPEDDAERALRELLGLLLAELRTPFPNLLRVAVRPELRGLDTLVLELEAALVPVNRRAALRSISRLRRETARSNAADRAREAPPVLPSRPELEEARAVFEAESEALAPIVEAAVVSVEGDLLVGNAPLVVPTVLLESSAVGFESSAVGFESSAVGFESSAVGFVAEDSVRFTQAALDAPQDDAVAADAMRFMTLEQDEELALSDPLDEAVTELFVETEESLTSLVRSLEIELFPAVSTSESLGIDWLFNPRPIREDAPVAHVDLPEARRSRLPSKDLFRQRPSSLPPDDDEPLLLSSISEAPQSDISELLSSFRRPLSTPPALYDALLAIAAREAPFECSRGETYEVRP